MHSDALLLPAPLATSAPPTFTPELFGLVDVAPLIPLPPPFADFAQVAAACGAEVRCCLLSLETAAVAASVLPICPDAYNNFDRCFKLQGARMRLFMEVCVTLLVMCSYSACV